MMCEGFSLEETLALYAATIAKYGFAVIGVGPSDDGWPAPRPRRAEDLVEATPWAYTVGLLDAAGHPELVMAGPGFEQSGPLLSRLGNEVLAGRNFGVGDRIRSERHVFWIGAVNPVQYRFDTFNLWHELAATAVLQRHPLEARQVLAPRDWCSGYRHNAQPVLADPTSRLDPRDRPNRAARRRRRRAH